MEQGNVTPSGQQAAGPAVRFVPVGRPLPNGSGADKPSRPQTAPVEPAVSPAAKKAAAKPVTVEVAKVVAEGLNRKVEFNKFRAQVRVDEGSNRVIVTIHSRDTGRLVRQLPPEGILMLAEKIHNAGPGGILLDDQI